MNDPNNPTMKPTYPWPSVNGNPPAHDMSDELSAQIKELSKESDTSSTLESARLLIRDVTKEECPWLPRDFFAGQIVYEYYGYCHGVISPTGTACTLVEKETPCYEFPTNSLGPL